MIRFNLFPLIATLLVLGFGYIILYLASKTEKGLKTTGKIIGIAIIALATTSIVLDLVIGIINSMRMASMQNNAEASRMIRPVPPAVPRVK
jgi:predicted exporter